MNRSEELLSLFAVLSKISSIVLDKTFSKLFSFCVKNISFAFFRHFPRHLSGHVNVDWIVVGNFIISRGDKTNKKKSMRKNKTFHSNMQIAINLFSFFVFSKHFPRQQTRNLVFVALTRRKWRILTFRYLHASIY